MNTKESKPIPTFNELYKKARKQLDSDHKHWREHYLRMKGEDGPDSFQEFLEGIAKAIAYRDLRRIIEYRKTESGGT